MMSMNISPQTLQKLSKINAVILGALVPPMLFALMLGVSGGDGLIFPQKLQFLAYVTSLVLGLLALKWNKLFYLSTLMWVVFYYGMNLEKKDIDLRRIEGCKELRRDSHCYESPNGTIDCQSYTSEDGEYHVGGTSSYICADVPK
jgi:hypothetical protein